MSRLSYDHGAAATPLLGEAIGENLRRTVEKFGEREALVVPHQGFRATYRELWELTGRAARGFLARGVKRGDRVGICSRRPSAADSQSMTFAPVALMMTFSG